MATATGSGDEFEFDGVHRLPAGGRWRLDALIGVGAEAEVWAASDLACGGAPRAVKLMRVDVALSEVCVARFRRAAHAHARFSSPFVVQLYDSGYCPQHGRHFVVMELVPGSTLAQDIRCCERANIPPDVKKVLRINRAALQGLDAVHRAGHTHRDYKPSNILITNGRPVAKLADFGLARGDHDEPLTALGATLGTPRYMALDVLAGALATRESDVCSAGLTLYESVAGHHPYDSTFGFGCPVDHVRRADGHDLPKSWAGALRHLATLVARMMSQNPRERPTAARAASELGRILRAMN